MENFLGYLQWYDYVRLLTMTLAFLALYKSGKNAVAFWDDYTLRLRELWWVFNALLLLLFEGTFEQILFDVPWGPRTLLGLMIAAAAVHAVYRKGGWTTEERNPS